MLTYFDRLREMPPTQLKATIQRQQAEIAIDRRDLAMMIRAWEASQGDRPLGIAEIERTEGTDDEKTDETERSEP